MSQAEELLNSLYGDDVSVYSIGDEPHIVVNSDRTITVPDELKHIAVQFDHNIETVTFDCPRYWDDHDFSKMHVYINYMCADGYKDQYPVKNLRVDDSDDNIIHFEWTISKNVTFLKGKVSFLVCIKSINEAGEEEPHWNSRLNQDLIIDEGMECTEQIIDTKPDVIENLLARMEDLETTGGVSDEQIENALNKYLDKNPVTGGVTDYNELTNKPITRVESLDTTSLVNLRDLESGQYILYGYFSPYENSDISISADNSMVSVIKKAAGSHIICLDPLNAKIVFFEILVDETAEKGFQYTRTIIPVLDVNALIAKVGELDELTTDEKNSLVDAINEVAQKGGTVTDEQIASAVEDYFAEHPELDGNKLLVVTFTDENDTLTPSHTYDQIKAWVDNGGHAVLTDGKVWYNLATLSGSLVRFERVVIAASESYLIQYAIPIMGEMDKIESHYNHINVTAEVGQTITVKSVDENGKPTEWEAVDFPEGGTVTPEQIASAVEDYMSEHPNSSQNPTGTKVYVTLADDGTIVIAPDVGDGLTNGVTITASLADDGTIVIGGE